MRAKHSESFSRPACGVCPGALCFAIRLFRSMRRWTHPARGAANGFGVLRTRKENQESGVGGHGSGIGPNLTLTLTLSLNPIPNLNLHLNLTLLLTLLLIMREE